ISPLIFYLLLAGDFLNSESPGSHNRAAEALAPEQSNRVLARSCRIFDSTHRHTNAIHNHIANSEVAVDNGVSIGSNSGHGLILEGGNTENFHAGITQAALPEIIIVLALQFADVAVGSLGSNHNRIARVLVVQVVNQVN